MKKYLLALGTVPILLALGTSNVLADQSRLCSAIEDTIGVDPATTIRSIGEPLRRSEKKVQNRFDNSLDKSILLEYPNGYVDIYYVTHLDKYIFYGAQLDRRNFNARISSAIPSSLASAVKMYGAPDKQTGAGVLYFCDITEYSYVELFVRNADVTGFKYTQEEL